MTALLRQTAEMDTRAALDAIVATLDGPSLAPELALVPFRIYGDALRLGLELPRAMRHWAEACGPALLDGVLDSTLALLDAEVFRPNVSGLSSDPSVGRAVVDRDHVESALHAVRRAWLPRPLSQLTRYGTLVTRIAETDRAMSAVLSRDDVLRLLDGRVAFGPTWAEAFRDDERSPVRTNASMMAMRGLAPSAEVVAAYIEGGAMQKTVEGTAAKHPHFSEELALAIDAARALGEVGFVARRWQRRHANGKAADDAWSFESPVHAEAASDGAAQQKVQHRLGRLFATTDIEASLSVSDREVTLALDFAPGNITRVSLGGEERTVAPNDDHCEITIARPRTAVRLVVVASSGETVSEEISLVTSTS